jgi:hypothetical protein
MPKKHAKKNRYEKCCEKKVYEKYPYYVGFVRPQFTGTVAFSYRLIYGKKRLKLHFIETIDDDFR